MHPEIPTGSAADVLSNLVKPLIGQTKQEFNDENQLHDAANALNEVSEVVPGLAAFVTSSNRFISNIAAKQRKKYLCEKFLQPAPHTPEQLAEWEESAALACEMAFKFKQNAGITAMATIVHARPSYTDCVVLDILICFTCCIIAKNTTDQIDQTMDD